MGSTERITADVCVIGGGPAGSTIAHQLASFGHAVCLVEREAFPEARSGASLPSSILPLLEVIGVRERIERAGFLRPEHIVVWWADPHPSVRSLPGPPGFHVGRSQFDEILLQNAAAVGVAVLRPAQAMHPQRLRSGGWQIPVRQAGEQKEIFVSFVVDATGSRGLLPGRRIRYSAPLLSLFARWHAPDRKEVAGRVEAGENEWLWYAPIDGKKSVAAVFTEPKRLSGTSRANIASVYFDLLRRFRLFREVEAGRIDGEVKACDASSRHAEQAAGLDFVRVGDAHLTLDPLSSQGVQSAVASGIQAAVVINTLARYPSDANDAIAFYRARQMEKISQFGRKTAALYQERAIVCDRPFWRQRAQFIDAPAAPPLETRRLDSICKIQLSKLAVIESMPTMQGDRISSTWVLRHEALERPVAFLDGVELVPLLRQIRFGQTADSIVRAWSERMSVDLGWKVLRWLWHRKIVVPVTDF
jgi:flavin-dependent dehydrogenase